MVLGCATVMVLVIVVVEMCGPEMDVCGGEGADDGACDLCCPSFKQSCGFVEYEAVFVGVAVGYKDVWQHVDCVLSCCIHEVEGADVIWFCEGIVVGQSDQFMSASMVPC